jgi:uncharacterized protein
MLERWLEGKLPAKDPSHDLDHYRTGIRLARRIAEDMPNVYFDVVTAAIYLHDIYPSSKTDEAEIKEILKRIGFHEQKVVKILDVLQQARSIHVSLYMRDKQEYEDNKKNVCEEAKIVSDALHLEFIGATGIGRLFAFSGVIGRKFIDKEASEDTMRRFDHRLKVVEVMLTPEGKKLGMERHLFTKEFYERFLCEWEGQC